MLETGRLAITHYHSSTPDVNMPHFQQIIPHRGIPWNFLQQGDIPLFLGTFSNDVLPNSTTILSFPPPLTQQADVHSSQVFDA